jgi:hypothetical protein
MNERRLSILLGLCLSLGTSSGCTYYFPHSLVASNIRTTPDRLTAGGRRVEAEICGNRLFTIPFGPEPRMSVVMDALQEQVTNAIGFEDIRIDVSFVNYLFPIFYQNCVQASAYPLFPVAVRAPKAAHKSASPAGAQPEPPTDEPSDTAPAPAASPDPFAQ